MNLEERTEIEREADKNRSQWLKVQKKGDKKKSQNSKVLLVRVPDRKRLFKTKVCQPQSSECQGSMSNSKIAYKYEPLDNVEELTKRMKEFREDEGDKENVRTNKPTTENQIRTENKAGSENFAKPNALAAIFSDSDSEDVRRRNKNRNQCPHSVVLSLSKYYENLQYIHENEHLLEIWEEFFGKEYTEHLKLKNFSLSYLTSETKSERSEARGFNHDLSPLEASFTDKRSKLSRLEDHSIEEAEDSESNYKEEDEISSDEEMRKREEALSRDPTSIHPKPDQEEEETKSTGKDTGTKIVPEPEEEQATPPEKPKKRPEEDLEANFYRVCICKKPSARSRLMRKSIIGWNLRVLLLDWMREFSASFQMKRSTYHTSVVYLDALLDSMDSVERKELQLIGAMCLFIASKYDDSILRITDIKHIISSPANMLAAKKLEVSICKVTCEDLTSSL